MNETRKLPQARMYLESARWGFKTLVDQKLSGYPYRFYIIGILAALRTVQHSLYNHDRRLSPEHNRIITAWWEETRDSTAIPELDFIKTSRDLILKEGSFESYATYTESSIGEENNREVTGTSYELSYYVGEERHDLEKMILRALDWCEKELTKIEDALPIHNLTSD